LDEHAEAAHGAHHELGQVEARGVLDDPPAAGHHAARPLDEPHADHEVAHPAVAERPGPGRPGGDGAPERRSRLGERRVERQVLAVLGEGRRHLGDRGARAGGEGELRGVVLHDPAQPGHVERQDVVARRRGERGLGAAGDGKHARAPADRLLDVLDGGDGEGHGMAG
jgi:hypothetical protein